TCPEVVTLTRNAPAKIAGQTPRPRTRHAASAIPAGGQTAEALALTSASKSPSFPAAADTAASAKRAATRARALRGTGSGGLGERPVALQRLHGLHEALELDRLHDVPGRAELVGVAAVAGVLRGGDDDHRNRAQLRVRFQLAQEFEPAEVGHAEVEQDDARP